MNNFVYFLKTLLIFAGKALAISAVVNLIIWVLSLLSICGAPTLSKFLWGAAILFALFVIVGAYNAIQSYNKCKTSPVYREVMLQTGISWRDYKKRILPLQNLAEQYPFDFRYYVEKEEGWHTYDRDNPPENGIMLIPNPQVTTSYFYYIKFDGPADEDFAIEYLIKGFMKMIIARKGR